MEEQPEHISEPVDKFNHSSSSFVNLPVKLEPIDPEADNENDIFENGDDDELLGAEVNVQIKEELELDVREDYVEGEGTRYCLLCLEKDSPWSEISQQYNCSSVLELRKDCTTSLAGVLNDGGKKSFRKSLLDAPYCYNCQTKLIDLYKLVCKFEELKRKVEKNKEEIKSCIIQSVSAIESGTVQFSDVTRTDSAEKFRRSIFRRLTSQIEVDDDIPTKKRRSLRTRAHMNATKKTAAVLQSQNTKNETAFKPKPSRLTTKKRGRGRPKKVTTTVESLQPQDAKSVDEDESNGENDNLDDGNDLCSENEPEWKPPNKPSGAKRHDKRIFCPYGRCKHSFSSQEAKEVHIKRRHKGIKKPYPCSYCPKSFKSPSRRAEHELIHSQRESVMCEICGKNFSSHKTMKIHQKNFHDETKIQRVFKCDECGQTYKSKHGLKVHEITHSKEYPFVCEQCGTGLPTKAELTYHQYQHQENNPLKCSECDKVCKNPTALKQHSMKHTKAYAFQCHICGLGCQTRGHLTRHMLIHSGEKKYECDVCHKKFCHLRSMQLHKRRHTNDRRHPCDICGKAFYTKEKMRGHRRIHTGEHPFECHICHKRFMHDGYISKHLAYHERAEKEGRTLRSKPNKTTSRIASDTVPSNQTETSGKGETEPSTGNTNAPVPSTQPSSNNTEFQSLVAEPNQIVNLPAAGPSQQPFFNFIPPPNHGQPVFYPSTHGLSVNPVTLFQSYPQ